MQYCSLQHQILLPSPDITRHSWASFPLWPSCFILSGALVAYWTSSDPEDSSFGVISFCLFYTVHEVLTASILGWFAIPSSLFAIREIQTETTMRYCYLPVRKAKIRNNYNIKCQQWCRETGSLIHCWHAVKMLQPLWKTVQQCLKLNT